MEKKLCCVIFIFSFFLALSVQAETVRAGIEANTSFWVMFNDQVENGLKQQGSDDEAAQEASGFNFKQGRLGFQFLTPDEKYQLLVRIRLEERTDIIDFWGGYQPAAWFNAYLGQMKIPSTFEVLQPDHLKDFISMTTFGQNIGDYSLARTPYISPLMSDRTYARDLGFAMKGKLPDEAPNMSYFLFMGNGVGAGHYVGGRESDEFLYANKAGDFIYGARLEAKPLEWVTIGGHYTYNKHDNAVWQDKKTVIDIFRRAWSTDLQVNFPFGLRICGFYGAGNMDDFINAQRYRFDYGGWGIWALQGFLDNRIEIGARYDTFRTKYKDQDDRTDQNNWTFGVNVWPSKYVRLQINYMDKKTENEFVKDVKDNIFYMNVQFIFDRMFDI